MTCCAKATELKNRCASVGLTYTIKDYCLTHCGKRSHFDDAIITDVPKAQPCERPSPYLSATLNASRNAARGWTRAARCCLILLACLTQLLAPAQPRHAPHFASRPAVLTTVAAGSNLSLTSVSEEKSRVPCPLHASSHDGNGPSPSDHGNCPCCACLCCCSLVHAALGILPQETLRPAYAPLVAAIAAPPALVGVTQPICGFCRAAARASNPDLIDEQSPGATIVGGAQAITHFQIED